MDFELEMEDLKELKRPVDPSPFTLPELQKGMNGARRS